MQVITVAIPRSKAGISSGQEFDIEPYGLIIRVKEGCNPA